MVQTAKVHASHHARWMAGDNDRNPFITQGYSFNPRQESELATQQRDARRRRLKRLRRAANGEEAND